MKTLKDFTIPFSSLKNGKTMFSYNLNNLFFETFNWEEFMDCSFDVSLSIAKSETMLDMNFTVSGEVVTFCDRCLDPLEITFANMNFRQLIKFVENYEDVHKDELEYIPINSHEINVASYLFEYCLLTIPTKNVHQNIEECNPNSINILEKYLLTETSEDENANENTEIDPRWNKLKELKNNKKQ